MANDSKLKTELEKYLQRKLGGIAGFLWQNSKKHQKLVLQMAGGGQVHLTVSVSPSCPKSMALLVSNAREQLRKRGGVR